VIDAVGHVEHLLDDVPAHHRLKSVVS